MTASLALCPVVRPRPRGALRSAQLPRGFLRRLFEVFERFSGRKDGTLWYYRALVIAFRQHSDHTDLIDELDRVVTEIERLST